ncbi:hypothetical protein DRW03_13650 [Corallococcus sp. H22C18031201]|nr:hypothetical protein DRW03_13650 [Corallococcus sp. H22C18031201]
MVFCEPAEHCRIADVVEEHGFPNEALFSHSFRRRFGCSAKDERGARVGRQQKGSARIPTAVMDAEHLPAPNG